MEDAGDSLLGGIWGGFDKILTARVDVVIDLQLRNWFFTNRTVNHCCWEMEWSSQEALRVPSVAEMEDAYQTRLSKCSCSTEYTANR